jgi:aryl-alcohol dehydrogenase-like predicted oxidoreductase
MKNRVIGSGKAALEVSEIGLGCMGMTYAYGASDPEQIRATLGRSIELGATFWDTSDSYGPYTNEELLAPYVQKYRNHVVIASKFGQQFLADGSRGVNGRPEYVRSACEDSLRRLGIETIDLYYQHRVDPSVPIEDTWAELSNLVSEGKIRCLGLSEASEDSIRRANAVHPVTALQTEWSLWTRDVEENGILAATRELGIGFVPYSPMGRGFLTGTITSNAQIADDDGRKQWPRFQDEAITANQKILDAMQVIATRLHASLAQVAIAWLLAQGENVVPIPGARKINHLEENCAATSVELLASDVEKLNDSIRVGATSGLRYPAGMMKSIQA